MSLVVSRLRVLSSNGHVVIRCEDYNYGTYLYTVDDSFKLTDYASAFRNLCVSFDQNFEDLLQHIDVTNFVPYLESGGRASRCEFYYRNLDIVDSICYNFDSSKFFNSYINGYGQAFKINGYGQVIGSFDRSIAFNTVLVNTDNTQYYDLYTGCYFNRGDSLNVLDGVYFVLIHYFDIVNSDFDRCLSSTSDNCYGGCEYYNLSIENHSQQLIGAIRVFDGNAYVCQADHVYDDDFLSYSIPLRSDSVDYYDYYFNGVDTRDFYHEVNCFGKSIVIEVRYVDDMASDESILSLKGSIDCICNEFQAFNALVTSISSTQLPHLSNLDNLLELENLIEIRDSLVGGLNGVGNASEFGSVFVSSKCNRKIADSFDYVFTDSDCNSLITSIKNAIDDNIVDVLCDFHNSFTHAFNKTLITEQSSFGSGSVFKSNDLDDHDYYYLIDNKGKSCDYPLNVNLCPFTFSEVPVKINSIPALDVDIDTMPTSRLVTHVNSAVDISCICDELGDIDEGLVAGFTAQGVLLTSIITSINELAKKFVTGCDTTFASAFSEAFNLTNCLGSVFKANDDNWNGEDTISGIWYKQLDRSYLVDNNLNNSCFWTGETQGGIYRVFSVPYLISKAFFAGYLNNGWTSSTFNLTVSGAPFKFSLLFRNALFDYHSKSGNSDYPSNFESVFLINKNSSDTFVNKILYNGCDGNNPVGIKFCEDVPLNIPTPEVSVTNNVPVPSVNVDVSAPEVTVNNSVPQASVMPDNIYINADGKTFLNNNNFR